MSIFSCLLAYILPSRNQLSMFEEVRYQEVFIKIKQREKQYEVQMTITLNEDNEVYVMDLVRCIKEIVQMDENSILFYYDPNRNVYSNLQQQEVLYIPYSNLASENLINILVESKISDELLANSPFKQQNARAKRSPERHIYEVFQLVETWRSLYHKGVFNEKGELQKVTLERSALITGVPRKSLQDYYLLLRNGYSLSFDFNLNSRKKVGILRNFVKQKKKTKAQEANEKQKAKNEQKQDEIVLTEIRKQIFGMTEMEYQQQLFRVVSSTHSSDEDEVNDLILQS